MTIYVVLKTHCHCCESRGVVLQIYCRVTDQPMPEQPTVDVTSQAFYGKGYDDSDRRIPDMTLIQKQLCKSVYTLYTCCADIFRVQVLVANAGWFAANEVRYLIHPTLSNVHHRCAWCRLGTRDIS